MNYTRKLATNDIIPDEMTPIWNESGTSMFLTNLVHIELEDKLFSKLLSLAQGQGHLIQVSD